MQKRAGFTLLELAVVVVGIAILVSVAVPMYKRAVLRSRFNTVIPVAKAVADAQEVHFLNKHLYARNTQELDVTPTTESHTSLSLSDRDNYEYVLAQRSDVPEVHYVIYQAHSGNYPGEVHCEAQEENALATYLCKSVGGVRDIGKTLTDGYTTWLIVGGGVGLAPTIAADNPSECAQAEALGYTCSVSINPEGKREKKICANSVCRTKTYNDDNSYTSVTCNTDDAGQCKTRLRAVTYDANGNQTSYWYCTEVGTDGKCSSYQFVNTMVYDENGNNVTFRSCGTEADGTCTEWAYNNYDYTYDAYGHIISKRHCGTLVNAQGVCTGYETGWAPENYDYTYDERGNKIISRHCETLNADGSCATVDHAGLYTYDEHGNQISERYCKSITADGTCTEYGTSGNYVYRYDANGNKIFQGNCNTFAADGTCAIYNNSLMYYKYDAYGNMISQRKCNAIAPDGTCAAYRGYDNYDYTYDEHGNQILERSCDTIGENGDCITYGGTTYIYTYDDDGKQLSYSTCSGSNVNPTTGECIRAGAPLGLGN